ncbi:ATPase [Flavobacterium acetivorans]|uniref:ATPase n=1 Tax=Flavobacterium acetivorans TaxID=2893883 RepID=UPI001E63D9CE|nr:ATPase [Flavobacterium sp. F-29]UFH36429.1 ATPase [Flavobacterium sp. F-29]
MTNHCKSVVETYQIINNVKNYSFSKCLSYLEYQGKISYGQSFEISEIDHETIYKLLIYAIKDKKEAYRLNLDLCKGILLSGTIGCGKTSIMSLLRPFINPSLDYKMKSCREIAFDFAKNGFETMTNYNQIQHKSTRLAGYCFDDLGAEQQIKHYGNDCNVMAEILISRYEHFVMNNSVTHLTTNLSATEIENFYGNRVRSRMRAMFNLIAFDKETKDKR